MSMTELIPAEDGPLVEERNPAHECEFAWEIENATKYPRQFCSSEFTIEPLCKPKFRITAKFHEKYLDAKNINIGLRRIDEYDEPVQVDLEASLLSINGDVYCSAKVSYMSYPNWSPKYCFSETFTASQHHLTFPSTKTSVNCENLHLKSRNLIGSYGTDDRVFYLPSNTLVIKGIVKTSLCCDVCFTQQTHTNQLLDHFKNAYQLGLLTDVRLNVGGETLDVHRFILCARSPVFSKMFEHDTLEKRTGEIVIEDMDKVILEALVMYLYTGMVKQEPWQDLCGLYVAADRYQVASLQEACSSILKTLISDVSVCRILEIADLHDDVQLKKDAIKFIAWNFSKVKHRSEWSDIVLNDPALASDVLLELSTRLK